MNFDELKNTQEPLLDKIEQVKAELLRLPNVLAVGVGIKETNNQFTDEISFRVYVQEKVDLSTLSERERIPEVIQGYKTDVLKPLKINLAVLGDVCGTTSERRNKKKYRPLKAGIAISTDSVSYGTLGWFGQLDADDTYVMLTNKHVLYDETEGIDERQLPTAQPVLGSKSECCCCECGDDNVVGETIIGIIDSDDTSVDCAIAKLNSGFVSDLQLLITNDSTPEVLTVDGAPAQAVVGSTVRKIGARSGYTTGHVVHIGDAAAEATDPDGTAITIITGQVLIVPHDSETYTVQDRSGDCKRSFASRGDSSSVVLNADNRIIALLYAVDFDTNTYTVSVASNINNVLDKLSAQGFPITLLQSPIGGGAREFSKAPLRQREVSGQMHLLENLRDTNRDSQLYELYEKHHREVLALINHARPVMVAWQRHQGPAFVAAIARAAREAHYRIPEAINGFSRTQLLLAMKEALALTGSAELQQDMVRYESAILQSVTQGDTIRALANQLLAAGLIDTVPSHLSPATA